MTDNMKNLSIINMLFLVVLMCLSSCDNDKAVKEFVTRYATAAANGDSRN